MRRIGILFALLGLMAAGPVTALAQAQTPTPAPATTSARVTIAADLDPNSATGIRIEGLVSDPDGRLYTSDLDSRRFFRITPNTGAVEVLGTLPRPASGMAFDSAGSLYMASGDVILRIGADALADALRANQIAATDVQTFTTGVSGANGLAFDSSGRLYVSGGNTGNIYVVASSGMTTTFASGFTSERQEQRISTNGLAFGLDGKLYSSNTGTGAIDRITVNADGTSGPTERFATNPLLFGADGITFAANGDLYVAANERNAIVRVTQDGQVSDVASNGNSGPLEFPASPSFSGDALYASNFDIERGANAPNAPGVGASIARIEVGVAGLPLPVTDAPPRPIAPPAATVAPVTPEAVPTLPAPTAAVPVPTVPSSPPTLVPAPVDAPGMPRTGGEESMMPVALLILGALTLVVGYAARRHRMAVK